MRKVLYLLGYLGDEDIEWMITNGSRKRLPAGTVLIREGQPIDALYILLSGVLVASFAQPPGAPSRRLISGEVVGEMSFIENRLPSATVTVEEDAVVLAIPRRALAAKLEKDTGFAASFYRAIALFLSHRQRHSVARLGYDPEEAHEAELRDSDELDATVLGTIHRAGARFDRVLQRLLAE